jgi:hypothetical protein
MQRRAEKNADEGRTQYADGEIFYSKKGGRKKHFRQSDGEYIDYEEIG